MPISQITSHLSSQQVGTLFLQLNVQDIGICIPFLSPADIWNTLPNSKLDVGDSRGAIVATVESSSVSACSAGSTVSTGKFTELCIRFADDFNHTLDDWKPNSNDPNLMNLCLVSEGSYEVRITFFLLYFNILLNGQIKEITLASQNHEIFNIDGS